MAEKMKGLIKGIVLALLGVAALALVLGAAKIALVAIEVAIPFAGVLLAGNSIIQGLELFFVTAPKGHEKLFTGYKVVSLMLCIFGAFILLTPFAANALLALWIAVGIIALCMVVDLVEFFMI